MSGFTVPSDIYLIIDNSVLSMLGEFYCARQAGKIHHSKIFILLNKWYDDTFSLLQQFAADGEIHCSHCVAEEFKPAQPINKHFPRTKYADYQAFRRRVSGKLLKTAVSANIVGDIKRLPGYPKKRNPGDNDLTLVALGLLLSANGKAVYILSNDQDLLSFVSWIRTKHKICKTGNPKLLQGMMGLMFLETIHRSCRISTEDMRDLVNFSLKSHYNRTKLAGTRKGQSIFQQLLEINNSLIKSIEIKRAGQGSVV